MTTRPPPALLQATMALAMASVFTISTFHRTIIHNGKILFGKNTFFDGLAIAKGVQLLPFYTLKASMHDTAKATAAILAKDLKKVFFILSVVFHCNFCMHKYPEYLRSPYFIRGV